ncbi:MAG: TetR/AcrR family transcriptional regulator [Selenomonadaceae bacterium]|nr:TetR/AcrR family transcriptional regulator [Selenomonadaceae bacterium]
MNEKVILAALEEMKIHALRFTMEDLTKRLHISKTSLYKIVDTKEKLIHEIINYLMKSFEEEEKNIKIQANSAKEKIIRFVDEYTKMFNFLESGAYAYCVLFKGVVVANTPIYFYFLFIHFLFLEFYHI